MITSEWTGPVGDVWAREWRRTDRSFAPLEQALEAAILDVAPASGRFVDIGCGAGTTSLAIAAARPNAEVIGLDLSDGLLAVARDRAAGVANLRFESGDASLTITDHAPVDLISSRHGVMFFDDPVAAFARLNAAAAPGAPLVFSCFRAMADNVWARETMGAVPAVADQPPADPDAPGPFAFADRARVEAILTAAGWQSLTATSVDYAYRAGEGDDPVADAVSFFARIGPTARALRTALDADREAAMAVITAACERYRTDTAVDFPAAAWIWTATATGGPRA
jgi:SAM-dependent methyltransferase